jgi:hypothetical protein
MMGCFMVIQVCIVSSSMGQRFSVPKLVASSCLAEICRMYTHTTLTYNSSPSPPEIIHPLDDCCMESS